MIDTSCVCEANHSKWYGIPIQAQNFPARKSAARFHRLGWHRLGYGEMTEELRVPCDHLEKLHLLRASVLKLALF